MMKRWGPILYVVLSAVLYLASNGPPDVLRRLGISLAVFAALVLVPSALDWKWMRWRWAGRHRVVSGLSPARPGSA
jgi:hypothetical protein